MYVYKDHFEISSILNLIFKKKEENCGLVFTLNDCPTKICQKYELKNSMYNLVKVMLILFTFL
jgi:hypothetical protein